MIVRPATNGKAVRHLLLRVSYDDRGPDVGSAHAETPPPSRANTGSCTDKPVDASLDPATIVARAAVHAKHSSRLSTNHARVPAARRGPRYDRLKDQVSDSWWQSPFVPDVVPFIVFALASKVNVPDNVAGEQLPPTRVNAPVNVAVWPDTADRVSLSVIPCETPTGVPVTVVPLWVNAIESSMLLCCPLELVATMEPAHVPLKSAFDASLELPLDVPVVLSLPPHAAKQTNAATMTAFIARSFRVCRPEI